MLNQLTDKIINTLSGKSNIAIAIAADHAGYIYKQQIIEYLKLKSYRIFDFGPHNAEKVDFPDYARPVCLKILDSQRTFGILLCGTGIGMSIVANRYTDIRAALCSNIYMAELARAHNNANILVLGTRINSLAECLLIIDKFIETSFEGGRHVQRIAKIEDI